MPDDQLECKLRQMGYRAVCGVDEAGRGPLAGPVCAAAVILPPDCRIDGVDDSKKLSEKKREALFDQITAQATAYAVAFATVEEIDTFNILQATYMAMERAIEGLRIPADYALIDGNGIPSRLQIPAACVVGGDASCRSIAAASILAKVTRDRLMYTYDSQYPFYGFAKHKGYGTKLHIEAIRENGLCVLHRKSFLKKII